MLPPLPLPAVPEKEAWPSRPDRALEARRPPGGTRGAGGRPWEGAGAPAPAAPPGSPQAPARSPQGMAPFHVALLHGLPVTTGIHRSSVGLPTTVAPCLLASASRASLMNALLFVRSGWA